MMPSCNYVAKCDDELPKLLGSDLSWWCGDGLFPLLSVYLLAASYYNGCAVAGGGCNIEAEYMTWLSSTT